MPRFEDFLNLNSAIYGRPSAITNAVDGPGGPQEWIFLQQSGLSSEPGYYGAAYFNAQMNEVVLVNRGTNDLADVVSDAMMVLDVKPLQFDKAEEFYQTVKSL